MDDQVIEFKDLPEEPEYETKRQQLVERAPCVPGKHHTFAPHETFCLCGALERGSASPNDLPWILTVWPNHPDAVQVYVVRFSNYDPAEIDSLWLDKEKALTRCAALNSGDSVWEVEEWTVK